MKAIYKVEVTGKDDVETIYLLANGNDKATFENVIANALVKSRIDAPCRCTEVGIIASEDINLTPKLIIMKE